MGKRVMLCADEESLRSPALIGLPDEALDSCAWLILASEAQECRQATRETSDIEEAWVLSCNDMEAINVAAALKADSPAKQIFLVSDEQCGSLASRAASANIDGLWSETDFVTHYAAAKQSFSRRYESLDKIGAPLRESFPSQEDAACDERPSKRKSKHACTSKGDARKSDARANAKAPDQTSRALAITQTTTASATGENTLLTARHAADEGNGCIVVVASGSGGAGKSTVAALAASVAAHAGLATAIVDADLQFGDIHHLLGIEEPLRIEEAAEEPERLIHLARDARRDPTHPAVLAAPRRLEVSELVAGELADIVAGMRADYDMVVVNTGSWWSDVHASVLEIADSVIFLVDQRASSLRGAVHAAELCARMGIATNTFTYAVNRHERSSLLSAVDVSYALHGSQAFELPDGGRDIDELLGTGDIDELLASRNELAVGVSELLARILPSQSAQYVMAAMAHERPRRRLFGGRKRR